MTRDERQACRYTAALGPLPWQLARRYMEAMLERSLTVERFWELLKEFNDE